MKQMLFFLSGLCWHYPCIAPWLESDHCLLSSLFESRGAIRWNVWDRQNVGWAKVKIFGNLCVWFSQPLNSQKLTLVEKQWGVVFLSARFFGVTLMTFNVFYLIRFCSWFTRGTISVNRSTYQPRVEAAVYWRPCGGGQTYLRGGHPIPFHVSLRTKQCLRT